MLTRVPEEIRKAEKAIDFDEFFSQEPLKFQFYYGENNQAEIINTIYLEDGNNPLTLYLEVFNDSEQDVIFKNPGSVAGKLATVQAAGAQAASEKKCHFQLRWQKDLGLKPNEIEIDNKDNKSGQWQVNYDEESRFFSMYFLHQSGLTLKPNGKIQISFSKLTANNRTVKSSNVELLYGGIGLISTGTANELIEEQVSSRNAVSVINHLRKTEIPLQFRVLGSNAILNDGTTQNTLKLKVLNSPLSNNTRPILLLNQSSKFIVSFEQGNHPDALVATTSQLNNVQIQVTDNNSWASDHTANSTQWSFTPKASLNQLTAGQGIELSISNLVTSSASGLACIYIDYQNIGSYPDGRLVIPIEKTPLLYSGEQVGIGTSNPKRKLQVVGDLILGKDETNKKFIFHSRTDYNGDFLQITHDKDNNDWDWDWNQGITLRRGGNVGIGIKNPQAKLHVNDGNAVISGRVGIGITNPTATLDVNGDAKVAGPLFLNNVLVSYRGGVFVSLGDNEKVEFRATDNSNSQGIAFTKNTIYASGFNSNQDLILKAKGTGKVQVDSNTTITGNATITGSVGIGTKTFDRETTKLNVNGDIVLGNDVPNGRFIIHTRAKQTGDYLLITHDNNTQPQDGSKNWEWGQGITLRRGGNVGIGTNAPRAKLDVNGSVKFGGNSTIINRMICGQVFYNTSDRQWQYKGFAKDTRVIKISTGQFQIYYGFDVQYKQELMILATTLEQQADHVACVREIHKDHCLICLINTRSQYQKEVNFSFMIIHFGSPADLYKFYTVEGSSIPDQVPIENYKYD